MKTEFCSRLRELRGTLSQSEFSKKVGVKQTSYSNWESGLKVPAASVVVQIATTLGVSTDWLLGIAPSRAGDLDAATAARVAELEREVAELRVRNRALMDALEAVGKGANSSRPAVPAGAGVMSA